MTSTENHQSPHALDNLSAQPERDYLAIVNLQKEIADYGFTRKGMTFPKYATGMIKTVAFLNRCHSEDITTLGMQDLIAGGAPIIFLKLKTLPQDIFIDIAKVKDLKETIALRILTELEPYIKSLNLQYQNEIATVKAKYSPSLITRFLKKINFSTSGIHLSKPLKLSKEEIEKNFQLQKYLYYYNHPECEQFEEAEVWLKTQAEKQIEELKTLAKNNFRKLDKKKFVLNYLPGSSSLHESHFLSYMKEVLYPNQKYEFKRLNELRQKHDIGSKKREWQRLQEISSLDWNKEDFEKIFQILSTAVQAIDVLADPSSLLHISLTSEKFLGLIDNIAELNFFNWVNHSLVSWFELSRDILISLPKKGEYETQFMEEFPEFICSLTDSTTSSVDILNVFKDLEQELIEVDIDEETSSESNQHLLNKICSIHNQLNKQLTDLNKILFPLLTSNKIDGPTAGYTTQKGFQLLSQCKQFATHFLYHVQNYEALDQSELNFTIELSRTSKLEHLYSLNFSAFKVQEIDEWFEKTESMTAKNRQKHLLIMIEELRLFPGLDVLQKVLELHSNYIDPFDQQFLWVFCVKNDHVVEIFQEKCLEYMRAEVIRAIKNTEEISDRFLFETFGLIDFFAEDMKLCMQILENRIKKIHHKNELIELLPHIENLERHILGITSFRFKENLQNLIKEIKIKQATPLDNDILYLLQKKIYTNSLDVEKHFTLFPSFYEQLHKRFQIGKHYSKPLPFKDIEEIKSRYGMVESIPINFVKQFAIAYEKRREDHKLIMREVLTQPEQAPEDLKLIITHQTLTDFFERFKLSSKVKLLMLYHYPAFLDQELQYLAFFLNFSLPSRCRKQPTYNAIVTMFRDGLQDPENARFLRRIKGKIKNLRVDYQPIIYKRLFEDNFQALMSDLKEVTGSKLDTT